MLHLGIRAFGIVAAASCAVAVDQPDILEKDVVIVGGGASGSYAAVRLRDDFGKSIALIEKEKILGGHVDSFVDPDTGIPYDFGVKSFIDAGNATGFFDRMGIERGSMAAPGNITTEYIDFLTGNVVDFQPPPFPDQLAALSKYLDAVEPWEHLIQPGYFDFPEPDNIPEDLLIPFGDFITKNGLEDAMPFVYQTTGLGVGNMTNQVTMFALQAFGASMARTTLGLQGGFVPASGRNQDLYDAVAEALGGDVMYSSTVVDSHRTDSGVTVVVKNAQTAKVTHIKARRLLMAIEPTPQNTGPFDLDDNEKEVLAKFTYTREYAGIIDNAALATNLSYFNLPSNAAPRNYLSYPEASFTARIDYMGSGHYFRVTIVGDDTLTKCGAKALVQRDFDTLLGAGLLEGESESASESESGKAKVDWVAFSVHGPMHARVSADEVRAGFFQDLYKLQGQRSTWWTGGAWSVNFQTTLWQYDDIIIPKMLEGLE